MAKKKRLPSNTEIASLTRDAEGLLELCNLQLRLATELRRKIGHLGNPRTGKHKSMSIPRTESGDPA